MFIIICMNSLTGNTFQIDCSSVPLNFILQHLCHRVSFVHILHWCYHFWWLAFKCEWFKIVQIELSIPIIVKGIYWVTYGKKSFYIKIKVIYIGC